MLLNSLWWIPDDIMVRIQYRLMYDRKLNLHEPKRFSEKMQWYKVYYRDPLMTQCCDKYAVRSYVERKGLSDVLNPLYGVYDSFDEIDFSNAPNQFVLKATDGSGGFNIALCPDKETFAIDAARQMFSEHARKKKKRRGAREWCYYDTDRKLIMEKFLRDDEESKDGELTDYKFFCFQGKPHLVIIYRNRGKEGGLQKLICNLDLSPSSFYFTDADTVKSPVEKPANYDRMVEIAGILSEDFPFVRVDLYNIHGKIIFGELTFYPAGGYMKVKQDEFDYELGELFDIPK